MTFKPAHKDTDNPPGQIKNEIPSTMGEKTIADIVRNVVKHDSLGSRKTTGDIIDKVRRTDPIQPKRFISNEILLEVMQLTDTCNIAAEQGKFDGYTEAKAKLREYLENM